MEVHKLDEQSGSELLVGSNAAMSTSRYQEGPSLASLPLHPFSPPVLPPFFLLVTFLFSAGLLTRTEMKAAPSAVYLKAPTETIRTIMADRRTDREVFRPSRV